MEEQLQEYASIKVKMKELEKREKELKPIVLQSVIENGDPIKKDYGTFVKAVKHNWVYSTGLREEEEQLKIKKLNEQELGLAKDKPTEYLTFKARK